MIEMEVVGCSQLTFSQTSPFFSSRKRERIEKELFTALAKRVDGCCRETCPTEEKDMPACGYCIPNDKCKNDEKGLFVEIKYFQLLAVDVHEDVKSRYLRQVTEAAESERAEFELREKVFVVSKENKTYHRSQ